MGRKRKTTEEWLKKVRVKREDKGLFYDYSESVYLGAREPIDIICRIHGKYTQSTAANHTNGSGCPICGHEKMVEALSSSTQEWIQKATTIHNHTYDYSESEYMGASNPITIICRVHGKYTQEKASNHLQGHRCPKCGDERVSALNKSSTEEWVQKSLLIHKNTYDYSESVYTGSGDPIDIICKIHGKYTQHSANDHLQGRGCSKCGDERVAKALSSSTQEWVQKAIAIHNHTYDYSDTQYGGSSEPICIICRVHGKYQQNSANDHLQGSGCPKCAESGFNKNKNAILYYIKIGNLYKIGITNNNVHKRYSNIERDKFDEVIEWRMSGTKAYRREQFILNHFKEYRYIGEPILKSGNTELFTKDVLELF